MVTLNTFDADLKDYNKKLIILIPLNDLEYLDIKENIKKEEVVSSFQNNENLKDVRYKDFALIGSSQSKGLLSFDLKQFLNKRYLERRWYNIYNILEEQITQEEVEKGITREYMSQGVHTPYEIFMAYIKKIGNPRYFAIFIKYECVEKTPTKFVRRYESAVGNL